MGIVHFGPGAFHRAHQADYIDRLLADDPRWAIAAVSMRSSETIDALARQKGRYTLAILDEQPSYRTIAAHKAFLGPDDCGQVRRLVASPEVRLVTSTVTEKGYCLAGDSTLDFGHPDIVHDLERPDSPLSLVGRLALGLADRRRDGIAAFVTLCCDNMNSNGKTLRSAVLAFAGRLDPELADWIAGEALFPDSMVDSITPATDEALRRRVLEATGFEDRIPVAREAYSAWIIEDVLPADGPDLASVGAVLTADVGAFERAKLRILNGAHSTLAYIGLLIGHRTVAEAMDDPALARFVERLIRDDIVPSLLPSPLDLQAYAGEILDRFRNPAIGHLLSQIAWDGSQKLPYRLLGTIADALDAGLPIERLAIPIAAWLVFVERQARAGAQLIDPLADTLERIGRGPDQDANLLAIRQIFPAHLAEDDRFRSAVLAAAARIRSEGARFCLEGKERLDA